MESNNECFVCGGHDFTIADGVFICNECGIQSQNFREELINFNDNIMYGKHDKMIDKDHEITVGSQLEKKKKLLSWECFNLILIGLTNEMIELGANPSLKVIVLQLWVRYLQCIEAAFTSKKFRKLPKLNTSFNNIDGEILYDIANIRKKLLYSKTGIWKGKQKTSRSKRKKLFTSFNCNASSILTASQKQIRVTHKLRKLDHTKTDINNDSIGFSNDVNVLQRRKNSRKINIKMAKNVQKSLKAMPSISKDLTFEESTKIFQSGRKCWKRLKHKEKKNMITIKKLISIIRLATIINNDDIYLSDILRWIHEGHFHINHINLFLPENVVHGINLRKIMLMSSRNKLNQEITMIMFLLKIDQLPNIDFKKMAKRFCDELQLPSDFTNIVCKLISISPPSLHFTHVLPDIEIKVMAYLLFAAKFLFCLDGNAENLSSDFAEKVNRLNNEHQKLFSWNEYVKYIECRNTVVSDYNSVLHTKLYENKIHNTKLFINNWNIIKSTLPLKNKIFNKKFRENTECLFKSLPDIGRTESYRGIPASTKPLTSTLKWILDYYSVQLSVVTRTTLENDFTQTDILYLTNEERIYDLANKYDIPIEINSNKPLYYVKEKNEDPDTKIPVPNNTEVKVFLTNHIPNKTQQTETLNTSYKEKPNTIYLGTGLYYWYIHLSTFFLLRADIVKIDMVLKKKLPHSFLWFMHQCCRILDCAPSHLYLELLRLEKKFSTFLQSNEMMSDSKDEDFLSNGSS